MLSNRKLTYSKVYVDSEQRLPNSNSSSDLIIEFHEVLETMPNTVMYVTEEIIPHLLHNSGRILPILLLDLIQYK